MSASGDAGDDQIPAGEGAEEVDEHRMSLFEHLVELRKRLRNAALALLAGLLAGFFAREELFDFLTRPLRSAWIEAGLGELPVFHFRSPTEPFWVYFKLSLAAGALMASPFVFWELWRFVAPGLYRREKRMALGVAAATGLCFSGGALFGYQLLCRPAAVYLLSFADAFPGVMPFRIEATIMMDEVFGFQLMMLFGCGVAFELPVIMAMLGVLGLVSARGMWRFNRFALVLATLVGGVLTPGPDVLSQLLLAGPIFALYNLSIVIVFLIERTARRRTEAETAGGS